MTVITGIRRSILIKFTSIGEKSTLVGLGISEENVKRLKEGMPIFIKGKDLGFDWLEIVIFYGRDEDELVKTVRDATLSVNMFLDKRSGDD